mgnify:CR=1 FL=1
MKKLLLILMLMPIVTASKNVDGSASEVNNYALIPNLNIWMYILGFILIVILIILIIKLWRKRK